MSTRLTPLSPAVFTQARDIDGLIPFAGSPSLWAMVLKGVWHAHRLRVRS